MEPDTTNPTNPPAAPQGSPEAQPQPAPAAPPPPPPPPPPQPMVISMPQAEFEGGFYEMPAPANAGETQLDDDDADVDDDEDVDEDGDTDEATEDDDEEYWEEEVSKPLAIMPLPEPVMFNKSQPAPAEQLPADTPDSLEPPGWATILGGKFIALCVGLIGLASVAAMALAIWYFFHKILAP